MFARDNSTKTVIKGCNVSVRWTGKFTLFSYWARNLKDLCRFWSKRFEKNGKYEETKLILN